MFAIQDEISRAIVGGVETPAGQRRRPARGAFQEHRSVQSLPEGAFLLQQVHRAGLRKALDLFQHALLQDPGYARAYAGIADVWCNLADDWVAPDEAYPMAKAAAQKALQRDPELAEAITSLGKVLCWHEWDFSGAERQLEHAVALESQLRRGTLCPGTALPLVGRLPDAIDELRKAIVLDPLSAEMSSWVARFLLYSKDYQGAITQGHKTLELDEQSIRSTLYIGSANLALGDAKTALEWYRRGQGMERAVRSYDAHIARALAALGERDEAEAILGRLDEESRQHYVRS